MPVVGTVLDPAVAETALRKIHPGNLCVVRVPRPAATLTAVAGRLLATDLREHGAYPVSPDGVSPHPWVTLLR